MLHRETPCVLASSAFEVLRNEGLRLKDLSDLQKVADAALVVVVSPGRCVTRQAGCSVAETEAHKRSTHTNKGTGTVRRDFLFIAKVKSVMNISVAFEKGHAASFFAPRMVNIVKTMVFFIS